MAAVPEFAAGGGLVLGICNGFQILCEAGLLPGVLRRNESLSFVCRDVPLTVERTDTPFTRRCTEGQQLVIPVKHGEGCWYADDELYAELEERRQIVLRYAEPVNGSRDDVAGVINEQGNVMGLMPHPEHAVDPLLGSADGGLDPLVAGRVRPRSAFWPPSRHHLPRSASASAGCSARAARRRSRSRARSVTGPRPAVPPVVYAKRTRRSPLSVSSSWINDANRLSPARCGSVSCSTA